MKVLFGFRLGEKDAELLKEKARDLGIAPHAYARHVFLVGWRALQAVDRLTAAHEALSLALDKAALDPAALPPPRRSRTA